MDDSRGGRAAKLGNRSFASLPTPQILRTILVFYFEIIIYSEGISKIVQRDVSKNGRVRTHENNILPTTRTLIKNCQDQLLQNYEN